MFDIETNRALARRYIELVAAGDAEAVANLFTDDGAILVKSRTLIPSETRGKDAIRDMIAMLPSVFPETGLKIIIDQTTAEDDRVAIVAHSEAMHISGKPYNNSYHFLLTFKDGKLFESHEYMDSLLLTDVFFDGARPQD